MGVCVCERGRGERGFLPLSLQKHIPEDILKATLQTGYPSAAAALRKTWPAAFFGEEGKAAWKISISPLTPGTYKNPQI